MVVPGNQILFLDIETVPQQPSFDHLTPEWKELWIRKSEVLLRNREEETTESIYPRAGIYAEFGKIICISCGIIQGSGPGKKLIIKSFAGDDEALLLTGFVDMLRKWTLSDEQRYLCAHNGKEFDFPFLCRRLIINNIPLPTILAIAGKKPWEVKHLDTMELWKFGDYKCYTTLNLLAQTLGVPTPKDDIDGSMVWHVYWGDKNLDRIINYCQKDVATVVQVYLRMNGETLVRQENIEVRSS